MPTATNSRSHGSVRPSLSTIGEGNADATREAVNGSSVHAYRDLAETARDLIFATDRELLDRFRRGERDALARVFEHYVDAVATLARRGFTIESSGHVYVRGTGRDAEADREREIEKLHAKIGQLTGSAIYMRDLLSSR